MAPLPLAQSEDEDNDSGAPVIEENTSPDSWSDEEEASEEEDSDEEEEIALPHPSQKKPTKQPASFSKSLQNGLSQSGTSTKKKLKRTLDNLLGTARKSVSIGAAKKETISGLKTIPKGKRGRPASLIDVKPTKKQKKSVKEKKGKQKEDKAEELDVIEVGLLALLPWGVISSGASSDSDENSEDDSDEDSDKEICLPPGKKTQKSDLMKLQPYGLVHLAEPGKRGIFLPANGTHEQVTEAILNYFPDALRYLYKTQDEKTPLFYVCTRPSKGRGQVYEVAPNPYPDGALVSYSCMTSRTSFRDRQVILTTSTAIPSSVLREWKRKRLSEIKVPEYHSLLDSPDKSKAAGSSKTPALTFFDDDPNWHGILPGLLGSSGDDESMDEDRSVTPTPAERPSRSTSTTSGKLAKGKGKARSTKVVIDVSSGDEKDSPILNDEPEVMSDLDESVGNPWGASRDFALYKNDALPY